MATSMKVVAAAVIAAIICSTSLLGHTEAAIRVKNQSSATNISVFDVTLNLTIGNLGPTEVGRFSEISKLNQDLFKIVNLMTNDTITSQFFTPNTTVFVLDDGFGDVSILVEPESQLWVNGKDVAIAAILN